MSKCAMMMMILSLALMANAQAAIGTLYVHANKQGSFIVIFDNSVLNNLAGTGIGDNTASSMWLPASGYYIDIYDGINYTGATKRYRTDIPNTINFSDESPSWNDRISSVKITPVPANDPGLAIWKNSNFGNAYQYFGVGDVIDINAATGFPNSAASSSRQYPYTLAYMFQNTGGINQCPSGSCAIYGATTTTTQMDQTQLNPNDKAKSLYVAAFNTPTTTTAVVSTTQAVTTTQAAATTTAAVTTTTAATTAAVTTTLTATTAAQAAVTTSVALLTLQAAGPIGGVAYRDKSNEKSGGGSGSQVIPQKQGTGGGHV